MSIYQPFWQSLMPHIIDQLQQQETLALNVEGIREVGDRQTYRSYLTIENGALQNPNSAHAHGRSLFDVLSGTNYFKNSLASEKVQLRISDNEFMLRGEILKVGAPEFFTDDDFDTLQKFEGVRRDPNDSEHNTTFDCLKQAYEKVNYLAKAIQKRLFPQGIIRINRNPINMAQNFRSYLWAQIYPNAAADNFKRLAFTVEINSDELCMVKIDTIGGLDDNDPIRKKYLSVRGDFNNSPIVIRHNKQSVLQENWSSLIDKVAKDIEGLVPTYEQLYASLNPAEVSDSLNVSTLAIKSTTQLNTILYGPPGTGKTYRTIDKALQIVAPIEYEQNKNDRKILTKLFNELLIKDWTNPSGQIAFITFHQSLSYEDFIEGIKPEVVESGNDEDQEMLVYEIKDGLFKLMAEKATWRAGNFETIIEDFKRDYNELENKPALTITSKYTTFDVAYRGTTVFYVRPHSGKKNAWYPVSIANLRKVYETGDYEGVYNPTYIREILVHLKRTKGLVEPSEHKQEKPFPHVLIIDEINRGNVAQIFGELITLIEPSKRAGKEDALEVFLPYSKKTFSVPDNLYIIGTMNTADRSVEALDTALRRRFSFEEMMPDPTQLSTTADDIDLSQLLTAINDRLETLIDRDHTIGHAWLIGCKDVQDVKNAFEDKIIPLLKEFFYNDYSKIGLVLGDAFVTKDTRKKAGLFASFAGLDNETKRELYEKPIYHIGIPEEGDLLKAFQSIYQANQPSNAESNQGI